MIVTIQINIDGNWLNAATYEAANASEIEKGIAGAGRLLYEVDYAAQYLNQGPFYSVSGRYPVNFEYIETTCWPSFLVDLLPGGAGRRYFEKRGNPSGAAGDWPLLLKGAANPPGHLRIAEAVSVIEQNSHSGFSLDELLDREDEFIEYAYQHGAPVAGSTGVQGDSPKFLLVEDKNNRWHAEGAISEPNIAAHWLVKFPRGKLQSDKSILFNESAYYQIAKHLGLRTHKALAHRKNTLFVPRFDRQINNKKITYLGQESLYSLAGISAFGKPMLMEEMCQVIARHATNPELELTEFILRDIANVALGNTDNHGRNTAMQYLKNGTVQLTPLYDFAPMVLDDAGIARVSRWEKHDNYGFPKWHAIAEQMRDFNMDVETLKLKLFETAKKVEILPAIMKKSNVETDVIKRMESRILTVSKELKGL